jgi:aminoglycoside phosphotransferase (APT) family kinase protein
MNPLFDDLNRIPWANLNHAYGTAEGIPVWIRQLLASEKSIRLYATHRLFRTACYYCLPSAYMIPPLLEILALPSSCVKPEILDLFWYACQEDYMSESEWLSSPWYQKYPYPYKNVHEEIAKGIPLYLSLLHDPYPEIRMHSARVLSAIPYERNGIIAELLCAYQKESASLVQANLILALGRMVSQENPESSFLLSLLDSPPSDLARFTTAISLIRILGSQAPEAAFSVLDEVLSSSSISLHEYPQLPGERGDSYREALQYLFYAGKVRLQQRLPFFLSQLPETEPLLASKFLELILFGLFEPDQERIFPQKRYPSHPVQSLTEEQKTLLTSIVLIPSLWQRSFSCRVLARFGFPGQRNELAGYLGLPHFPEPPSPPRPPQKRLDTFIQERFPEVHSPSSIRGSLCSSPESETLVVFEYESGNKILFHISSHLETQKDLIREATFLQRFGERFPLGVPVPSFFSLEILSNEPLIIGSSYPSGLPFYKEVLDGIDDVQIHTKLAQTISQFLSILHHLPHSEWEDLNLPDRYSGAYWTDLYHQICLLSLSQKERRIVSQLAQFVEKQEYLLYSPSVIYGALRPEQFVYDVHRQEISGIISFEDIAVGDPAWDIAPLLGNRGFRESFVESFLPWYSSVSTLWDRAIFYNSLLPLVDRLTPTWKHERRRTFSEVIEDY